MKFKILIASILMMIVFDCAKSQQKIAPKIRVILFGTFHFGSTSDKHSTSFPDVFSIKRQEQLDLLADLLAKQHPSKIFVEAEPQSQSLIDSLYRLYQQNKLADSTWLRNEIVQLGFRTARKTSIKTDLICVDHRQELPYPAMQKYEKDHENDINPPFFDTPYPFSNAGMLKLKDTDLSRYFLQINTKQARQRAMYDYLHYSLLYGKGNDYTGVEMSTSWYNRNFKILTNIFRAIQPADQCILIIMGSSHTALLHELLTDHPGFEIVDLATIL